MFDITALAYGIISILMAYAAAAMGDVLSVSWNIDYKYCIVCGLVLQLPVKSRFRYGSAIQ